MHGAPWGYGLLQAAGLEAIFLLVLGALHRAQKRVREGSTASLWRMLDRVAPMGYAHRWRRVVVLGSIAVVAGALIGFWLSPE